MPRALPRILISFALLLVASCSDDDGGTGVGGGIDRSAQFSEDGQESVPVMDDFTGSRASNFVDDNEFIDALMDDLSVLSLNAKPESATARRLRSRILDHGRVRLNKGIDTGPEPGTYHYSTEGAPHWVLVDPENPVDSSLFLIREQDGAMIENAQGVPVPAVGEIQYWYVSLALTQSYAEWTEAVEIRAAPIGIALETLVRTHAAWLAEGDNPEDEIHVGVTVGDQAATNRGFSEQASWIGDLMYFAELFESSAAEIDSYGIAIQLFHPLESIAVYQGIVESRTPVQPPAEGEYDYSSHVDFGFGLTTNPLNLPWLLYIDVDSSTEPESWDGAIFYRDRKVATIEGSGEFVSCVTCDPVVDCADVWVTWTNDPENPILFCELMQWFDEGVAF